MIRTRTATSQREVIQFKIPMGEIIEALKRNLKSKTPVKVTDYRLISEGGVTSLNVWVESENTHSVEEQRMELELSFRDKEPEDVEENPED